MAYMLFVDDEEFMQRDLDVVAELFRSKGHEVAVTDGQGAWDLMHQRAPDILVTDVMMPKKDGFELIVGLKKLRPINETGVILLATCWSTGEPEVYGTASIDFYVFKPFDLWQIVITVKHLLYRLNLPMEPGY